MGDGAFSVTGVFVGTGVGMRDVALSVAGAFVGIGVGMEDGVAVDSAGVADAANGI